MSGSFLKQGLRPTFFTYFQILEGSLIMKSKDKNVLQSTHKGNFKNEFGYDIECHVLNDKNKTARRGD